MLQGEYLREDLMSSIALALLAIPLSLAIALASEVPPEVAITTAMLGGMVAALFGGSRLAVTGPAAAMAVLVASVVEGHGLLGLFVVTIGSGLLQLATGTVGLGRLIRLVPMPVIEGFTAGIGAIILIGQLPRMLGLRPPDESHVFDVILHIADFLHETRTVDVIISLSALALALGTAMISKRLPGPLFAVVLPSLAVAIFGLSTPTVGAIPASLSVPDFSAMPPLATLVVPILLVYALGALESLLSSAAVDKLAVNHRHDPDQELVGLGLANVAAGFFGGMPATGVIARSALNVQAGGRTRRAALFHAVIVGAFVFAAGSLVSQIPLAALAGVLFSVAIRMLNPRKLINLWKISQSDAAVYLVTFVVIVTVDLMKGVQWGIAAALVIAAVWSTRTHFQIHRSEDGGLHRFVLNGPLTFFASLQGDTLRNEIEVLAPGDPAVIDLRGVPSIDATGAELILEVVDSLKKRGNPPAVLGANDEVLRRLIGADHTLLLQGRTAATERDLIHILNRSPADGSSPSSLEAGLHTYRLFTRPGYAQLFGQLSGGQNPHTLFVTCSDSRVVPTLITDSQPGDLFILRNVGNLVPPFSLREAPSAAAALEYAVGVLGVTDVVICGHSGCGAIHALRNPHKVDSRLLSLQAWLKVAPPDLLCDHNAPEASDDMVARRNVELQLKNLRSYEVVRHRVAAGQLRLHGWFFDIAAGDVEVFEESTGMWSVLDSTPTVGAAS